MCKERITCFIVRRKALNELYGKLSTIDINNSSEEVKKVGLQLSMIRLAQSGDRLILTSLVSLLGGGFLGALIFFMIK